MDQPLSRTTISAQNTKYAKYFRALAMTASSTDSALSFLQLAIYFERLGNETAQRSSRDQHSDSV